MMQSFAHFHVRPGQTETCADEAFAFMDCAFSPLNALPCS